MQFVNASLGQKETLLPGELARLTGLSKDTLRHYERLGLLEDARRGENGYRHYRPEALERVQLIQRALMIGFSLGEIQRILAVRHEGRAPCREVRALAAKKLEEVEQRLAELNGFRQSLQSMIEKWDAKLSRTAPGEKAHLLEIEIDLPKNGHSKKRSSRK